MSTQILLVVVFTRLIRLLISFRVSGFPSTDKFLSSCSFLTTSSSLSWLFLKSSFSSLWKSIILSGREDRLLSFTYKHVRFIKRKKQSGIRNKLLWLKFSDRIFASDKPATIKSNILGVKYSLLRSRVLFLRANVCLTADMGAVKVSTTK